MIRLRCTEPNKGANMTYLDAFNRTTKGPWNTGKGDVQWKIERDAGRPVLSFQCTKGEKDWRRAFDIAVKPYTNQKEIWYAHRGWAKGWDGIKDDVMDALMGQIPVILGFSAGGAYATLAHENIYYTHALYPTTITFGSPQTIWLSWNVAWRFDGVTNVVVSGDPIPGAPGSVFGYHHVGKRVTVGKKLYFPNIASHTPDAYRRALDRPDLIL